MRRSVFFCVLTLLTGCVGPRPPEARSDVLPAPQAPVPARFSPPPPPSSLGVDEAIALALANSPYISTHEADIRLARARYQAVDDLRDPELRVTYGESEREETLGGAEREEYRGALRIYTENPWSRGAARSGGEAMVRAAQASLRAIEQATADQVRSYFLLIRQARDRREQLERIVEVRRVHEEQSRELMERGVATAPDVLRARLGYLGAVTDREQALSAEQRLRNEFAALLGLDTGHALDLEFDEPMRKPAAHAEWRIDDLTDLAFAQRNDLAAAELQAEVARWDVSAARRLRIPWFTHVQGAMAEEQGDPDEDVWAVQAAITLPFFAFRNHNVDVLRADAARFESLAEEAREAVRAEIRQAVGLVRLAHDQWFRLEQQTGPTIAELQASLHSELGGALSPDDRADLAEGILEAEGLRLNAIHQYESALFRLRVALGSERLPGPIAP